MVKLFVPGRVCLLGEHSDWAGGYRRVNSKLEKGYAIITGTNQGIHAEVEPHPTKLIIGSTVEGGRRRSYEIEMDGPSLLARAQRGGFFSYACGVAYQFLVQYNVRGLRISTNTDLPIKKGLSSSAAICVLVARAFNRIYDLKMTTRGEMECAYQGEINTPSRCGRMDQGCAYGQKPIMMTFDGDRIQVEELRVARDLFFLIVDLNAGKDTMKILDALNKCFPVADDDLQKGVHEYLGPINKSIVHQARKAIEAGDAEELGRLMDEAQEQFDRHLTAVCPSELAAPVLHKVLRLPQARRYMLGAKGVGSQGDGSAQILVRDADGQAKVSQILERELGLASLPLIVRASRSVRRAVIPAAGFGTRLFPASKTVKKELFPVVDASGRAKPAIFILVEELLSAGIEEVAIVIQERDHALFQQLFHLPPPPESLGRLTSIDREYCDYMSEVGRHVRLVIQEAQDGFGHAVFCARDFVGDQPFLLLLGDHLFSSDTEVVCAGQLLAVYERHAVSVVGLKVVSVDDAQTVGCVAGPWRSPGRLVDITRIAEKPSPEFARENLAMDGLPADSFLGVFGQYVLTPRVFGLLAERIGGNAGSGGELDLTSTLDSLRREEGVLGYLVEGESYDIGMPEKYRKAMAGFGRRAQAAETRDDAGEPGRKVGVVAGGGGS